MQTFFVLTFFILVPISWAHAQFGPGPQPPGKALDDIVAVVEDDIITRRELNAAMARARRQLGQRGRKPPPPEVLQGQVLESLVVDLLQLRAAQQSGIVIDDQTLNAAVEDIARRNNIGLEELRRRVEREGTPYARFREDIRRQLLNERLRQRFVDSQVRVSDREVDTWLQRSDSAPTDTTGGDQRDAAREALFRQRVEEEWQLWLQRLLDEAYVEVRL